MSFEAADMRFLIVEDDDDLREVMRLVLESKLHAKVLEAPSGNQAIALLEKKEPVDAILCDYTMNNGTGGDVFQFIRRKKLKIPFILCSSNPPSSYREFDEHQPEGVLLKPFTSSLLVNFIKDWVQKGLLPKEESVVLDYCSIRLSTLLKIGTPKFDLFVKLGEGKYVKIFKSGATFGAEEMQRASLKKSDFLYLKKEDVEAFLQVFSQSMKEMQKTAFTGQGLGFEVSHFALQLIQDIVLQTGLSPAVDLLIKNSVEFVVKTLKKDQAFATIFQEKFLSGDDYLVDHSVVLAYSANLMASKLGLDSEVTFKRLTFAAFLHDVCIKNDKLAKFQKLDQLDGAKDLFKFTYDELESFRTHPEKGAELCRKIKDVPAEVDIVVQQHHEQPDGTGFPKGITDSQITQLSIIFQLAHQLVSECFEHKSAVDVPLFLERQMQKYSAESYKKIIAALLKNN